MSHGNSSSRTRTALWVKVALAVSLTLNLLVVGFLAGTVARHGGAGPGTAPALNAFGRPYMVALSKEDRQSLRQLLRAGGALPDRRQRRDAGAEVLAQLRAQPFDIAALEEAVRQQADISLSVQRRVQAAWLQTVSEMTDAQRQTYADDVEELLRRRARKP